jgi:signal transduction histidine kinase
VLNSGRRRRTLGDWAADAGAVAAGALLGAFFLWASLEDPPSSRQPLFAEFLIGGAACVALFLRRRWPVGLMLVLIVAGLVSSVALGPIFVALFNVAIRRSWRVTAVVTALHIVPVATVWALAPVTPQQYREAVGAVLLLDATMVASGMLVRSQRLLVHSLQERARQAEEGQRLRVEEARRLERERIAREMHDVLAHRISLLTMHAGALEFRPDAPPEQISQAAGVIRSCAFEALEELREVIGVLRESADGEGADAERPQPTLAGLPELVEDSRRTGSLVSLDNQIGDLAAVPAGIGRHAYRIVQEGLTNARKHAPGTEVCIVVTGVPGGELTVELRNRLPPSLRTAEIPGAGAGLVGLAERADLVGGRLEHGRTVDGDFRLWASLPWPR